MVVLAPQRAIFWLALSFSSQREIKQAKTPHFYSIAHLTQTVLYLIYLCTNTSTLTPAHHPHSAGKTNTFLHQHFFNQAIKDALRSRPFWTLPFSPRDWIAVALGRACPHPHPHPSPDLSGKEKKKVRFFQTDSNAGEGDGVSWKSVITH